MKKKCQIHAVFPITCFSVPIVGHTELNLTTDEIYQCLCAKAEVAEVLPNGKTINLDFSNYNKDNFIKKEDIKKPEEQKINNEQTSKNEEVLNKINEESKEVINEDNTVKEKETEQSLVKTHEVSSRNNNYKNNYNKNKKNNKR